MSEATKQLSPVYDQQEKAISSQIPAIQNLYNSLITGLQGQYNSQLQTGTQGIVEDASARGVLRSTLPVDARQGLTAELGRALMEGQAQYGRAQAGDIAGINEKLGGLKIQRTGAIADLARSLETKDLERQQFEYQKKLDAQKLALERQALAMSSRGGGLTANQQYQIQEKELAKFKIQQRDGGAYSFSYAGRPINMAKYLGSIGGGVDDALDLLQNGSSYDKKIYNSVRIQLANKKIKNTPAEILKAIQRQDGQNYYGFRG